MQEPNIEDDLVRDYLAECGEHLATIENDLLLMEQSGQDIDENLVNRVFRAAHSIKGGAGFFDLSKIRELAHKTENALDLIRSRQMIPTPDVVSVLLLAFDKLRGLLADYRTSNQADIDEFVQALAQLTTDHLPEDEKNSIHEQVAVDVTPSGRQIEISAFDLTQARRGGKCIYLIDFDLIHDIQRRGKTPLELFRRMGRCGEILDTAFDLDSAGLLDDSPSRELSLQVLYATVLEPDLIGGLVEVPMERVRLVEKNGLLSALGAEAETPVPAVKAAPVTVRVVAAVPVPEIPSVPELPHVPEIPHVPETPHVEASAAKPVEREVASPAPEQTIRLNIGLLDSLMTLAGELVLSRNQLNESLARKNERGTQSGAQRISLVTSELQALVTQTRMQPVAGLFSKFPRLVRDLSRDLGKQVELKLDGTTVEIDKSILEGLSDPLTHMVRNAVDHGIETPAQRVAAGKQPGGTVLLQASHQAGQVVIEVSDDGKGLDGDAIAASAVAKGLITREQVQAMPERERLALIMLPGVSTAKALSDISGRGVGMDVVKTNLDKLGGKVDIESVVGEGTRFRIKLPLTLAIIPSLLVSHGGDRFAIPQLSVSELIRIAARQLKERINRVGDADVLILRDRLVPLVDLSAVLNVPAEARGERAMNVALVNTGTFEYGLIVDELHDTVEIVVKPLGRHLKGLQDYAGATILGDGRVAVILDVAGLSARAGLTASAVNAVTRRERRESVELGELRSLLLFRNAPEENCAVPIELVSRVERIRQSQVEHFGGRRTMQYRGGTLPLVALSDTASVEPLSADQRWAVIVFEHLKRPLGLLVAEPLDMVEARFEIDDVTLRQRGIAGSAVLKGRTTLMVDIDEVAGVGPANQPEPDSAFVSDSDPAAEAVPLERSKPAPPQTVLVAEDSTFFRGQLKRLIEAVGYRVLTAEDGQAAWEILDQHAAEVDMLATDIEMPRLDGLSLTRQIRADKRFTTLPIIALSSLAGDEDIARGRAAGVTEYQVKLNQDELVESIRRVMPKVGAGLSADAR
jgi:two-component system, chemotaxis family, sensor kinase CheA